VSLKEVGGAPEIIILATGSEVGVAVEAAQALAQDGRRVRVVSMPCLEVFARQSTAYREAVLPSGSRRVSVEAGRTDGWWRWLGDKGLALGVDTFGASAPGPVLAEKYGLTGPQIADKIRAWFAG
jgi:transketolase